MNKDTIWRLKIKNLKVLLRREGLINKELQWVTKNIPNSGLIDYLKGCSLNIVSAKLKAERLENPILLILENHIYHTFKVSVIILIYYQIIAHDR